MSHEVLEVGGRSAKDPMEAAMSRSLDKKDSQSDSNTKE